MKGESTSSLTGRPLAWLAALSWLSRASIAARADRATASSALVSVICFNNSGEPPGVENSPA